MILGPDGTNGQGWSPYGDTPVEIARSRKAKRFKSGIGRVLHFQPDRTARNKVTEKQLIEKFYVKKEPL
jgi:hypothetical protein